LSEHVATGPIGIIGNYWTTRLQPVRAADRG
jgi:hypothetical protein